MGAGYPPRPPGTDAAAERLSHDKMRGVDSHDGTARSVVTTWARHIWLGTGPDRAKYRSRARTLHTGALVMDQNTRFGDTASDPPAGAIMEPPLPSLWHHDNQRLERWPFPSKTQGLLDNLAGGTASGRTKLQSETWIVRSAITTPLDIKRWCIPLQVSPCLARSPGHRHH